MIGPLSGTRNARLLLAEDDDDDVMLLREALECAQLAIDLFRVTDGEQCLAFLRKEGEFAAAATPDLLLLDLNMPRMDGREVMTVIANDRRLWAVPTVIFTTSSAESDVLAAQNARFHSYIVKPSDFSQLRRVVGILSDYWFTVLVRQQPP